MIKTIDLSGKWLYAVDEKDQGAAKKYFAADYDTASWKQMDIPNNWYLTEVGDFFGTVWFKKTFDAPAGSDGKDVFLKFYAVDYFAEVWLNGEYLGAHEGYFTPFEFNVAGKLLPTGNVLVVRDSSPRDGTEYLPAYDAKGKSNPLSDDYRTHWAKDLHLVKGHLVDAMHRPGSMTKFRDDGNTGGIWQKVELIVCEKVRILKTKIYSKIVQEDGSAIVSADLSIYSNLPEMVEADISMLITPDNFKSDEKYLNEKKIQIQPGLNEVKFIKTIEKPMLWSTWDFGNPNLYNAELKLEGYDCAKIRFGIKDVTYDPKRGYWCLNGQKVFLRGMRYYSGLWMSVVDEKLYREDLDRMLDLNINSIRIGSHVEKDEFYDLCDEMGFLVWQVFPYHYCYTDSDDLIERSVPMMKQLVEMLYNHASLGAWSVFKEPEIYGLPGEKPNNYGRLCQMLIEAAKTVDPIRWMHSGDYREGVMNITIGQCYEWDWDIKKHELTPIIVEYGCGAFVSKESMLKVLPEAELWPPKWDQWEYYNCFYNITFNVAELKIGDSLEQFIDNSQVYQARSIKEQIEYCRQIKYSPINSMYLYYWSEPWANIGASGLLDYFRKPLKSYDSFKQVYTPVLVSFEWNKDPYIIGKQKCYNPGSMFDGKLWVTNDKLEALTDVKLDWSIVNDASKEQMTSGQIVVNAEKDDAKVAGAVEWNIPAKTALGEYRLVMKLTAKDGQILSENDFEFEIVR